ncbi:hypothetical protein [Pseudarthrobacter niigatensis]|uniref:Uncharacterized protein n=1 Tax=Pseudarthrobacter niigatensis TaxID=369935 RepID=A0AAJ1SRS3_9MICC|nr:hypothetical protein [Pseudarthrobacter niigatensis]MDQ0145985.1 hypothetical protein [Pseudarthrobacter niigatensis]MDQ0266287.1 hypothetical protein [Pseudarthrobacter niigatensis]
MEGLGAEHTRLSQKSHVSLPANYLIGMVSHSSGATIPGKRLVIKRDATGRIDDITIEDVA